MRSPFTLIGVTLLAATMLPAAGPVHAADLDHPYDGSNRRGNGHKVRGPVIVQREIEVVPLPVPVAPPPPDNGPYGPFTYFPTHYPNYGYGY